MNLVSIRLCGILSLNDCINVELMPPMHVDAGMIVVVVVLFKGSKDIINSMEEDTAYLAAIGKG